MHYLNSRENIFNLSILLQISDLCSNFSPSFSSTDIKRQSTYISISPCLYNQKLESEKSSESVTTLILLLGTN